MKPPKKRTTLAKKPPQTMLNECLDMLFEWGEGFCASQYFKNLSEDERMQSESIAGFFTEMMFEYLGRVPQEWDAESMKECCIRLFPEKVSEGPEFFRCIVPVLSAFFSYLEEQHLQKNAGAMAHEINSLHNEMMERSANRENWGMAKRLVMAARSDGVDVTDPKAIRKYIDAYNQKVLREGPASGIFHNAPHDAEVVQKSQKKSGRR